MPNDETVLKNGRHFLSAAAVALFFTVVSVIAQPLELFSNIQNDYTVGLYSVLIRLILTAAPVFTVVLLTCTLTHGKLKEFFYCLWMGIGIALYVESNFFSIRLHQLDGTPYRESTLWKIIDVIAWGAAIALPFILCKFRAALIYKFSVMISGIIVFMLTISTISVIMAVPYVKLHNSIQIAVTNKDIWQYSSSKNLIIILTDEYDLHCFENAMEQDPETIKEYTGFTFYSNTIGTHIATVEAVPYMFTGETDTVKSRHYDNDDFFKTLSKNGYKSDLYSSQSLFSDQIFDKYSTNTESYNLKTNDINNYFGLLMKCSAYKLVPSVVKQIFWLDTHDFEDFAVYDGLDEVKGIKNWDSDNMTFYRSLADSIELTDDPCFKFIYLNGLHLPRTLTSDLTVSDDDDNDSNDTAIGLNKVLAKYLKLLKDGGVYNNSDIIILADHGLRRGDDINIPDAKLGLTPMLLIKRAGDSGELRISKAPISYNDLYPTFMYLIGGKAENKTVFDITEDQQRVRHHDRGGDITKNVDELDEY